MKETTLEIRDRILTAGEKLLLERGYKGVTTDAVAKRARVSKKTLYAAFPSKNALMEAILLSLLQQNMNRWDEIISGPGDPLEKIKALLVFLAEFLPQLQDRVFSQVEEFDPGLWARIEELRNERMKRLKDLIVEAQDDGLVRNDLDPDLWLTLLLGAVRAVVNPKALISTGISSHELVRTIGIVFYEGILTEKGRKSIAQKGLI